MALSFLDLSQVTVEARQRELGTDPESLFAFVRDAIGYEPYQGLLRGAQGTLLSRRGTSRSR